MGLVLFMGLSGFEPPTPALSAQCSNRLSYRPEPKSVAINFFMDSQPKADAPPAQNHRPLRYQHSALTD